MSRVIEMRQSGDFKKNLTFLTNLRKKSIRPILEKYGQKGVEALAEATPKATGKTAASWSYEIKMEKTGAVLSWHSLEYTPYFCIISFSTPIKILVSFRYVT